MATDTKITFSTVCRLYTATHSAFNKRTVSVGKEIRFMRKVSLRAKRKKNAFH